MFSAQPVTGPAYLVVAAFVGMVVLVVGEADRIENQVIMNVILVNVGGEDKFIFAAQDLPRQFHADPVGFLDVYKRQELEAQLTEEENLEIVRMVKAVRMDNKELTAFLKAYASGLITRCV